MFQKIRRKIILIGFISISMVVSAAANNWSPIKPGAASPDVKISAVPWGPSQSDIDRAKARVVNSPEMKRLIRGATYRLVGFEYVDNYDAKARMPLPPVRYRAIFYDYSNDRTFIAESDFAGVTAITTQQAAFDPGVGREELRAAYDVVKTSREFVALAASKSIQLYDPMPPVSDLNGVRLVNVGIRNPTTGENTIVGVSFKNSTVVHYSSGAPPTAKAVTDVCGIPNSGQGSTGQGFAGQYQLTVTATGGSPLWEMLVTRPSASSGIAGSGIDLQNVKFKGKSVLKRAHVPVLDIKYGGNACGPFVDWLYDENPFDAPSAGATYPNGPGGGIVILAPGQVATTSLESGDDTGNFQGVAIYRQGTETVLVSEMSAGWYRYIMEWRFDDDGTIRPRFGFGSTANACVCLTHYHHVYWRFDFDIVNPNNRVFQVERGRKFLKPIKTETALFRDYATNRSLLIQNGSGDEAYMLVPNYSDGFWDAGDPAFGVGDFWVLKTAPGNGELGTTTNSAIDLSPYLNNESVDNTDLTVWYAAHFTHSDGANRLNRGNRPDILTGDHVVGPDIRPIRW